MGGPFADDETDDDAGLLFCLLSVFPCWHPCISLEITAVDVIGIGDQSHKCQILIAVFGLPEISYSFEIDSFLNEQTSGTCVKCYLVIHARCLDCVAVHRVQPLEHSWHG